MEKQVKGPSGVVIPAGLAYGATLRAAAICIAKAADKCCAWRYKNVTFSSFLPRDPFDDGEYVLWLLSQDMTT